MYYNELYHHGRLGQKWGKRNGPPYPLSGGTVSEAYGKKKNRISAYFQSRKEKKAAKSQEKEDPSSEQRKTLSEGEKEKLLREGTASEVYKYQSELTNQELNNALNRIRWRNNLAEFALEETEKGWKSVDQVMKKVGNVKDWTRTGIDFYKTFVEALELIDKEKKK